MAQLDVLLDRHASLFARGASRRSVAARRTMVLGLLNVAMVWIVAGSIVWQGHRDAIEDAKAVATNLSLTTAGYTQHAVGSADLLLRSILDWLEDENLTSEGQFRVVLREKRFHDVLRDRIGGLPQVPVASVYDNNGTLLTTSFAWPTPDLNVGTLPTFQAMLDPRGPDVVTTEARQGRMSGQWTFYISRKIRAADGTLLGLAVVGLDSAYFGKLFSSLALGDSSWVSLFRDDGALLATSLSDHHLMGHTYHDAIPLRLMRQGFSGQATMVEGPAWWSPSYTAPRLVAPRQVEGFPYLVSVNIAEAVILARWTERSWLIAGLAFAISVAAGLVTAQVMRLTVRTERSERVAAERRMLAALIDTPAALAAVVDRQGLVLYCNERFREVVAGGGEPRRSLHDPAIRNAGTIFDFAARGTGAPQEADLEVRRANEAPRYLHFSVSAQDLPDLGACTILVGHDETLRRQTQKALTETSKLVTLGEMTTGMAHELSQPLNVIRMAAQNALTEVRPGVPEAGEAATEVLDDAALRRFLGGKLDRIMAQVDRAASIIARMRVFGRRPEGRPGIIDAREVCRDALSLLAQRLRNEHIVVTEALGDRPLRVRAHVQLAEQVLVNLLLNAIDAVREQPVGERRIAVEANVVDGRVLVTVSDNGPGVPAAMRERIFEPFFTSKAPGQGTGLGLSLSYGLVREAGGTLSLLPTDRGAAFRIDLPEAAPDGTD
ncbi:MAG: hypothetical protein LCH95_03825 [Proteobacteria bacterium]|nr:hypothetical protein [Pseudomonadota bacterium]